MHLVLPVLTVAVLVPLAACDLSQKTPETLTLRAGAAQQQFAVPIAPSLGLQAPTETQSGVVPETSAGGERSIRLYGPGVSRKRQTRV
jgi:hypothetical protein